MTHVVGTVSMTIPAVCVDMITNFDDYVPFEKDGRQDFVVTMIDLCNILDALRDYYKARDYLCEYGDPHEVGSTITMTVSFIS